MKKTMIALMTVVFVVTLTLAGCKKQEEPAVPEVPTSVPQVEPNQQ